MTKEQQITVKVITDSLLHLDNKLTYTVEMEMQFHGKQDIAVLMISGGMFEKKDFQFTIDPNGSIMEDSLGPVVFSDAFYSNQS